MKSLMALSGFYDRCWTMCRGAESNCRRKVLQTFALPLSYRGPPYSPKSLRKFLNKVDGLAEGVDGGGGVDASIGFS